MSVDASALQHLRVADPILGEILDRFGPDGLGERREGGQRPHRTLACRYLWRSLDNEPDPR